MKNNEPLILKYTDANAFDSLVEEINNQNTKDELVPLSVSLYNIFKERGVRVVNADGKEMYTRLIAQFLKKRYSCSKSDIAIVLALGICSMDNLNALLDACPFSGTRELLILTLKSSIVTNDDIRQNLQDHSASFSRIMCPGWLTGQVCTVPFISVDRGGYDRPVGKNLPFFHLKVRYPFRNILRTQFLRVERPKPLADIDARYRLFTEGSELEQRFPVIEVEESLSHFDFNDRGLLAPSLRTTAAAMQLTEFFPKSTDTYLKLMRARMALSFMAQARHFKSSRYKTFSVQMKDFDTKIRNGTLALMILFRHIKGFNMDVANSCRNEQIFDWLINELKIIYTDQTAGWISIKDFAESMLSSGLSEYTLDFLSFNSYRGYWNTASLDNKFTGHTDCNLRKQHFFTVPYVRGLFFILASLGYFDLAFDDDITPEASPYDTLVYARPTALGLYLLKLTPSYEGLKIKKQQWFEADEKYLIVRSLADNNPYLPLLSNMATPIGGGRLAFTAKTMLKDINSFAELEKRIGLFYDYVSPTPPPIWTAFFERLKNHCQPFDSISTTGYRLLKLRQVAHDSNLLQLLAPGTPIGRLCIRAEGYRILVPTKDYLEFVRLLQAEGYMV